MQRIRHRKFEQENGSPRSVGATHIVRIGFDKRELMEDAQAKKEKSPKPGKLTGFLISHRGVNEKGFRSDDLECMKKLNSTPDQILQAKKLELSAPKGLLPEKINFILPTDAKREGDIWTYPGMFSEQFEYYANGMVCFGNGDGASRRQEDGSRKEIECVPHGKTGSCKDQWCPFSVEKKCKYHSRLSLSLYVDGPDGKPRPLCDRTGWQGRYRFATSSAYSPMEVLASLDHAADRLNGFISGIPGTISFAREKADFNNTGGKTVVGRCGFILSAEEIYKREQLLWSQNIQHRQVFSLPSVEMKGLSAYTPDVVHSHAIPDEDDMTDDLGMTDTEWGVEEKLPDATEPEAPSAPEEMSDMRRSAIAAKDILMQAYPMAKDPVGFELYNRWNVTVIEDVPEEGLAELINVMREIYREQQDDAEGENQ